MKKIILLTLIICSMFTTDAQTGPTKEETMNYIKSFFNDDYFKNGQLQITYIPMSAEWYVGYKVTDIYFVNCTLHVSFEKFSSMSARPQYERKEYFTKTINISEIDEIEQVKVNGNINDLAALKFKDKNNTRGEDLDLPFSVISKGTDIKNTKLFKAFNHLRKLCGAPEPISFD